MSAVFAHGKRYDFLAGNPISGVRCSAKRVREPELLTPTEFAALMGELPQREQMMVMLAGTTGLRRSELIAVKWRDVDFDSLQISVSKSCVRAKMGETKTAASAKPVPLHPAVAKALKEWRCETLYMDQGDFCFVRYAERVRFPSGLT